MNRAVDFYNFGFRLFASIVLMRSSANGARSGWWERKSATKPWKIRMNGPTLLFRNSLSSLSVLREIRQNEEARPLPKMSIFCLSLGSAHRKKPSTRKRSFWWGSTCDFFVIYPIFCVWSSLLELIQVTIWGMQRENNSEKNWLGCKKSSFALKRFLVKRRFMLLYFPKECGKNICVWININSELTGHRLIRVPKLGRNREKLSRQRVRRSPDRARALECYLKLAWIEHWTSYVFLSPCGHFEAFAPSHLRFYRKCARFKN